MMGPINGSRRPSETIRGLKPGALKEMVRRRKRKFDENWIMPRESFCKFCGVEIEWGQCDGKWLAMRKDLMGFHQCVNSMVPRFRRKEE